MTWLIAQRHAFFKIAHKIARRTSVSKVVVGIFVLLSGYGALWALKPENFPVTGVQIVNDQGFVPQAVLTELVMPHLGRGFIRLDVSAIADSLMQQPWVKQVTVRRIWPDSLVIRILEHQPEAQWNQEGILSLSGKYIEPDLKDFRLSLPQLLGPAGQQLLVYKQFKIFEEALRPYGLKVLRVELADRGAWSLQLDSQTQVLLGKVEVMKRFERFIKSFDTIIEKQGVVPHTVDCRYTSGIAVS